MQVFSLDSTACCRSQQLGWVHLKPDDMSHASPLCRVAQDTISSCHMLHYMVCVSVSKSGTILQSPGHDHVNVIVQAAQGAESPRWVMLCWVDPHSHHIGVRGQSRCAASVPLSRQPLAP